MREGGYLRNLVNAFPNNSFTGVDISTKVLKYVDIENIDKVEGTLVCLPFEDNRFDLTYTCEALEHAVDIESAIREMARVTTSGGYIVVIDKNREKLGEMQIEEWEQWFEERELTAIMSRYCESVYVTKTSHT